jgi:hypothetical protein
MGSISFSNPLLQSAFSTALQGIGLTGNSQSTSSTSATSGIGQDNSQISPFAQLLNTLQQLQQTDPNKYSQVTQQIAANLQSASQTETANGNTAAANQLNQLSSDFSAASGNGQLPDVADLAKALSGGRHHHHGSSGGESSANASSDSNSDSDSNSTSIASQALSQFLAAFESASAPAASSSSTDPMSIIRNTLSSAGVNPSVT